MIITGKDFEEKVLKSRKTVLVDFFATWCGPCKMMMPIIEELEKELEGKVEVYKIDTDNDPEIAMKYDIMSIPTFIAFKNGEVVAKEIGMRDKKELLEMINNK